MLLAQIKIKMITLLSNEKNIANPNLSSKRFLDAILVQICSTVVCESAQTVLTDWSMQIMGSLMSLFCFAA